MHTFANLPGLDAILERSGWLLIFAWTGLATGLFAWNQHALEMIEVSALDPTTLLAQGQFYRAVNVTALGALWLIGGIGILGFWRARRRNQAHDATDKTLRASEAHYRMVADFTYDWEYWRAPDGRLLYCSPACERITGYTAKQFCDDPGLLHRIVHPDDLPFLIDHTHDALNGLTVSPIDFRITRRDGQIRWIGHTCQAVHTDAQEFRGNRVSNRDITDRKMAEQQLALQTIALQTAANSVMITDREGKVVFVNAAFCAMTGYTPREVIGNHPRDLVKSGKQDKSFYKTLWDTLLAGRVWHGEIVNRKKDGSVFTQDTTITPVRLERDVITHFVAMQHDITARKQSETELARTNALLRATLDSTADGIQAIGEDGEIATYNQKFLEMWCASDELMTRPREEHIAHYARQVQAPEEFRARLRELSAHPHQVVLDTITLQDGRTLERAGTPYRLGGYNIGRVWSFRDITERKRAEAFLEIQRDLGVALNHVKSLNDALTQILRAALNIHSVDCGGVYIVDPHTGALDLAVDQGLPAPFIEAARHFDSDTPQTRLVMTGKPTYAQYDRLDLAKTTIRAREGLRAFATIPVLHEGAVIAALNLASHTHDDIPTYARRAFETIAAQIGGVIARMRVEHALHAGQTNLQLLFDTLTDFIFILDANGCITHSNPEVVRRLGYSADELRAMDLLQVHPPEQRAQVAALVTAMLEGKASACPIPLRAKNGSLIPVETKVTPGLWNGEPAIFGVARDISERLRMEEQLRESETRFRNIFQASPIAIQVYDAEGKLIDANRACLDLFGVTELDAGRGFNLFTDPNVSEETKAQLRAGKTVHYETPFDFLKVRALNLYPTNRSGTIWLDVLITPLNLGERDASARYLVQMQDITERKVVEERLEYLSMHDPLTGLWNRAYFEIEMARQEKSTRNPISIVMVDADNMKITNDTQGHTAGDELLRAVARVLQKAFRAEDVIARIGGDEFVVILPGADARTTQASLARVRAALAQANAQTKTAALSLSLGAATGDPGMPLHQVLIDADAAMYADKAEKYSR